MSLDKFYKKQSFEARKSLEKINKEDTSMTGTSKPKTTFNPNDSYYEEVYNNNWKNFKPKEYHEYREKWITNPRDKFHGKFPLHLDIETTNVCNLVCPMCPRTIQLANNTFSELGFMTRDEYQLIIDQAVEHNCKAIKLNYLGEPLSHKDVIWQVEYAKKKGILDVMFNTNASLLDKEKSEKLLEAGIDGLFVSFDAIDPSDYEKQRKGTTIGKVIDNLFNFIILRNQKRPSCQIRVSMVMYKQDKWIKQFEAIKEMWKNHVDAVGYGYFVDRDINNQINYEEIKGYYCSQPFQRMFIKYNGNVTVCCVDDKDEIVMGNWRKEKLKDIWNGEKYQIFRKKHADLEYYKIDMCKKCYMPYA
jgi:radical SAM protein with 4Fe4S-binding SPASM domain